MLTVIVFFRLSILSFSPEKDKACLRQLISFLSERKRKVHISLNRSFVHKQNRDSTGDMTAILHGHTSHVQGWPFAVQRGTFISQIF